jgi:hypothetical protein
MEICTGVNTFGGRWVTRGSSSGGRGVQTRKINGIRLGGVEGRATRLLS